MHKEMAILLHSVYSILI